MISKIALALATLSILILNNSMIASAFTTSIKPNILVQKETPEHLAAQALYYAENASTFNNQPEYQKQLKKAKKLILALPKSEAKKKLKRALDIHLVVEDLPDCEDSNSQQDLKTQNECTRKKLSKITDISPFAAQTVTQLEEELPIDISFIRIRPRLVQDAINWRKFVLPEI
ncbi:hypothetical protein AFK68_05170 [Hydrocoleum sp. CS-953]|uniref:hypothetical protein n=1 Tax=Hydrocoleum sp. CS-953 TaxID=1671698 RepID=UPI000B9BBAFB|nr:hypothetical protein [Hydrocoleum sp. CS-953]OZH55354.1 hypothetical protein AFK68_05170 [Hydrocoleum sp. CS-953]